MSAVVDASVLVSALVDTGAQGRWAEQVLASGPLYAPEIAPAEAANILRRLEISGKLQRVEAQAAFDSLMQLSLELFPFAPCAERAWELRHTVSSYDAWYVAVAEGLRLPLATLDGRLARASGCACEFLLPGS